VAAVALRDGLLTPPANSASAEKVGAFCLRCPTQERLQTPGRG
jgi:hypothetical protein